MWCVSCSEGALRRPYGVLNAARDYDAVLAAADAVERALEARNALFVEGGEGDGDKDVLERALRTKEEVDTEYQKVSAAGAAVKARMEA